MDTVKAITDFVLQTVLAELLIVILGVLFARLVQSRWEEWKYGGWRVVVIGQGQTHVNRGISTRKAKEIREEPADLSVFLKGTVSPYAFLRCDIIQEGVELGLLRIDEEGRVYTVDLDKNPPQDRHSQDPL
jgi:hypothetical protein